MMFGSKSSRRLLDFATLSMALAISACGPTDNIDPNDPNGEPLAHLNTIVPATGSPYGGLVVTITGDGFKDGDRVSVGGVDCTPVVVKSSTELTCTNGQHAAGKVDVVLTRKDIVKDTLEQSFTYACNSTANPGITVWANEGGEKIVRESQKAVCSPQSVINSVWDGTSINLFGARQETVGFNLVLEAPTGGATGVSVSLDGLTGPGGTLRGGTVSYSKMFDWTTREIELFYVQYLEIKGLSKIHYNYGDERQVPRDLQRPWTQIGIGSGTWEDRPNHNKSYPDILAPLDTHPTFNIADKQNQSIWGDIFIPKDTAPGIYTGNIVVKQGSNTTQVPVRLTVRNIDLPPQPVAKTMVYTGYKDLVQRYFGVDDLGLLPSADQAAARERMALIYDRHFQMAHRHRLSLIDENSGEGPWTNDQPRPEWEARLSGSLFTASHGYAGPGLNAGNNVYAIGAYGHWSWNNGTEADMRTHTDAWESWFQSHFPSSNTEHFLFLVDEPPASVYPQVQQWATWMKNNPGVGKAMKSFSVIPLLDATVNFPGVDIVASLMSVGDPNTWVPAVSQLRARGGKQFMYNGKRPASGSMATEDDGVAMREHAWGQYKMGIDRWFLWQSTYYNNYQGGLGQTDLFHEAQTFGGASSSDTITGRTAFGNPYGNGDGVLFYPGTDKIRTADNLALDGPVASLRMKLWRRGLQDVDYLAQAKAINPGKVDALIKKMVPKALWEVGVDNPADPTYVHADISWSIKPDDWESARAQLADIIEGK